MNLTFKEPIVAQCVGCEKVLNTLTNDISINTCKIYAIQHKVCQAYAIPSAQWRRGNCPMSTNVKREEKTSTYKLNPLKASKRQVANIK